MSASIFSFSRSRSRSRRDAEPADWTTQELAELYRVCDRLVEAGLRISLCRGLSDEGEPWAIFEREDAGEVVVHIARIDGYLVVVNNATNQVYKGVDFRTVTEQMLVDAPLAMPRRHEDPKVVYHPRAVFTAFVAAAIVVTEMARNVETAEAGEASAGAEAAMSGSGMLAQLVARFLSRDGGQPVNALAAGSGAFGLLGAAALAVDMFSADADAASALAAAGDVGNIPTQRIDPALSAAVSDRSARSENAVAVEQSQTEFLDSFRIFQASLELDTLKVKETEPQTVSSSGGVTAPAPLAQRDLDLPPANQTGNALQELAIFDADPAPAERGTSQPLSATAPLEVVSDALRPSISERQKIVDAIFIDFGGKKSEEGVAILVASSRAQDAKAFGKDDKDVTAAALADEDSSVISHVMSDGGIYILDPKVAEHIVYTGGDTIIHNFRFGQDQIEINHMGSSGDWVQDMYIVGNDVRLVGVDGGSITLYDSLHSLA